MDDICVEQIKKLGTGCQKMQLFNQWRTLKRKSKVMALVKPGKKLQLTQKLPCDFSSIIFSKFIEKLIIIIITNSIGQKLIPQYAGFRPGKSRTSQTLNLTKHRGRIQKQTNIITRVGPMIRLIIENC